MLLTSPSTLTRDTVTDLARSVFCAFSRTRDGLTWHVAGEQDTATLVTDFDFGDDVVQVEAEFPALTSAGRAQVQASFEQRASALRALFQMRLDAEREKAHRQGLSAALQRSGVATLLVDRNCTIFFANAAAEAILHAKTGLRQPRGALAGSTLAETFKLQAAINHVADDRTERTDI